MQEWEIEFYERFKNSHWFDVIKNINHGIKGLKAFIQAQIDKAREETEINIEPKELNKMSNKILLTDKLREIIEQAHMAGYNECCDRSPSAYEARIYCNSVELEAEQIIKQAKLDLIDEILTCYDPDETRLENISPCVYVSDIIKIKEKL